MSINVCSSEGYLGTINITPGNVIFYSENTEDGFPINTVSKRIINNRASVVYTISAINNRTSSSTTSVPSLNVELDAEFRIESENLQTGQFQFNFTQQQINTYGISLKENGFTFSFDALNPVLEFELIATDFYENYLASIIVDSLSAGYGASVASLDIRPPSQAIQADNFLDYLDPQLLPPEVLPTTTPSLNFEDPLTVSDKLTVLNEYVYYSKEYEESDISEQNLLNINKNYSSIDIKKYFENIRTIEQFQIILHSSEYVKELYPQFDKQKFLFPMYMEIKFQADTTKTQLNTFLKKLGLLDYFCLYMISKIQTIDARINIQQLLQNIDDDMRELLTNINLSDVYNGKLNNIQQYKNNNFQKTILLLLLEKELYETRFLRTGQQQGATETTLKQFYSNQILMYKISKYKLNQLIGQQYFINTFENQELTYFDTQVKYNTEYRYTISAIKVLQDGSVVEEVIPEYTIQKIKIVDNPPLPPDITYVPFKGIDNQIMLNLNPSSGKYCDYPIIVRNEDVEKFQNVIDNSRDVRLKQEKKVLFETDDDYAVFELFRLETPPKSYDDYKNIIPIETENTSILDDIEPNKKYYYIARVRDIHGNISNPTKPIEVEMINENGTIFMVKREYMFGEGEKIPSKTMKKFLQIKPNNQQAQVIYPQATSNINEFNLGNKEVSLWNKQFLMRVTSKNTGKKIDVKFKMTYSKPN